MSKYVTIRMTREEAKAAGLLTCECGHPENNHFDHDARPCAGCVCNHYKEQARFGRLIKPLSDWTPGG